MALFDRSAAAKKAAQTRKWKLPRRSPLAFTLDQIRPMRKQARFQAKRQMHTDRNREMLELGKRRHPGQIILDRMVKSRKQGRLQAKRQFLKNQNVQLLKGKQDIKKLKKASKRGQV